MTSCTAPFASGLVRICWSKDWPMLLYPPVTDVPFEISSTFHNVALLSKGAQEVLLTNIRFTF